MLNKVHGTMTNDFGGIIHIFKSTWVRHPLRALEEKPEGALIVWGFECKIYSYDMHVYDFQDYLDYIRAVIKDTKI
jgi:hypothetical protein